MTPIEADKLTHKIASSNWNQAGLESRDVTLCEFACDLTRRPNQMNENHILELRGQGFSDRAIHDAAQVISYFNYINRIADSLNVDLEDDIHAWEQTIPG